MQQHIPNISIKQLREDITTVSHIKPKGRPKHTGTVWPSKRKAGKHGAQKQPVKVYDSMRTGDVPSSTN